MSEPVKVTDQTKEGEQKPTKVGAKASTENFTAENQVQPTEKFSTWSSEEPKKVLVAARPGETLEEFKTRTKQYHEELEQRAKQKPAIQPFSIGGFEDGSEVTAGGKQKPADKVEPATLKNERLAKTFSLDPRPSYVEGLKAIGNNEEAQGKYSIEYIERKVRESQTFVERQEGSGNAAGADEPVLLAHDAREKVKLEGYVSEPENPFQAFKHLTPDQQKEVIQVLEKASQAGQDSLNQQANGILTGQFVLDFISSIDRYTREHLGSGTWKEALAHVCQKLQEIMHGEKVGEQEPMDKALTLGGGILVKATQGVDQVGQHANPHAFITDTHAAAEAMRAGVDKAHEYYGEKFQNSELGSIPGDTLDAMNYAKERAAKAIEEFADKDVSEQSNVLGMAATIVFLMAATRELITPAKAREMGLLNLTEEELEAQGIQKKHMKDMRPEDIVNPIDRAASNEVKIAQLQALSRENQPLIDAFRKEIDNKYGSFSYGKPKEAHKILEKSQREDLLKRKPWLRIEHLRDAQRFTTVVDNLDKLPKLAQELKNSAFEVIEADVSKMEPNKRGWRMMPFDLRAPNGQLVEYQVLPTELYEAGNSTHALYDRWRDVKIEALSVTQQVEMNKDLIKARQISDHAWAAYLKRTQQTTNHVKAVLEQVEATFKE